MSDPKTSLNNHVSFQDRLAVVGNAGFICFAVSVVWTALFIGKAQVSLTMLVFLAAPLIATGLTIMAGALAKDFVPKPILTFPLNFTVPLVWCTICFLAVLLISTQETGGTRVPEALLPALAWSRMSNLIPVLIGQIGALSIVAMVTKENA